MVKPAGTGTPSRVISARFAPLPPSRLRCAALPSARPAPKKYTRRFAWTLPFAFFGLAGRFAKLVVSSFEPCGGCAGVGRGRSILTTGGPVNRARALRGVGEGRAQERLRAQLDADVEAEEALHQPRRELDVALRQPEAAARAQRSAQAALEGPQQPRRHPRVLHRRAGAADRPAVRGHEGDACGRGQLRVAERTARELRAVAE